MNTGTPAGAKQLILAALAVTGILTVVGDFATSKIPRPRIAVGLAVIGISLTATAEVAPKLAASMALLIAGTAVFVEGAPAFQAITRTTQTTSIPAAKAAAGGGGAPAPKAL